jgi:hypothetical protein
MRFPWRRRPVSDCDYLICVDLATRRRAVSFNSLCQCQNITPKAVTGPKMHRITAKARRIRRTMLIAVIAISVPSDGHPRASGSISGAVARPVNESHGSNSHQSPSSNWTNEAPARIHQLSESSACNSLNRAHDGKHRTKARGLIDSLPWPMPPSGVAPDSFQGRRRVDDWKPRMR